MLMKIKFFMRPQTYPVNAYWLRGDVLCVPIPIPDTGLEKESMKKICQRFFQILAKQDRSGQKPYIVEIKVP